MPDRSRVTYTFSNSTDRGLPFPFVGDWGVSRFFSQATHRITTEIFQEPVSPVGAPETNPVSFLEARLSRLERETSTSDWDSPRAARIPNSSWARVRAICHDVGQRLPEILGPFVSAARDGSIHLRWNIQGGEFLLELSNEEAFWTKVSGSAPIRTGSLNQQLDFVEQIVAHLL